MPRFSPARWLAPRSSSGFDAATRWPSPPKRRMKNVAVSGCSDEAVVQRTVSRQGNGHRFARPVWPMGRPHIMVGCSALSDADAAPIHVCRGRDAMAFNVPARPSAHAWDEDVAVGDSPLKSGHGNTLLTL